MAYNSKNFYLKVKEVQDVYLEHQKKGATNEWIYKKVIHPRFLISRTTFYKYLGINARKKLKEMEEQG